MRNISYHATDSRLKADLNGKKYDGDAMIERFKKLGRKLTDEESEQFWVK